MQLGRSQAPPAPDCAPRAETSEWHPPSTTPCPEVRYVLGRRLAALPRRRPEAFQEDRVLNLWDAAWRADGRALPATSPVDGSPIAGPPRLNATTAHQAVRASLDQHRAWRHVPLAERRARVAATLDALTEHRELLALLLVWEIGKPWRLAQADVDRAIDGVRWYVDGIEPMVDGRAPLDGPVSNIASWNYPMSVLVHAMLVQALAGTRSSPRPRPTAASPASPWPARSPHAKDPRHPRQRQRRRAVGGAGPRARDRLCLLRRRP